MSAMCGIVHTDGRPLEAGSLNAMLQALDHRGVDGRGSWLEDAVGLGHQMLHVTPQSLSETLPFHHAAARLTITADARLDNREELCALLAIDRHERDHICDSQLILKAYAQWGEHCPEYLLGDFAFALWDADRRRLFCATDPMGVRPLFYHHVDGLFAFASEIKAIHALPGIQRRPNLRRIAMLSLPTLLYQDEGATFFEGIHVLPASSCLTLDLHGLCLREYWAPDRSRRLSFKTEDDCVEAFQEVFFKAVAARLRSAFPVASMYSGGLDSSAITGTAADILRGQGQTLFAVSAVLPPEYQGGFCDERAYIDQLRIKGNINIDHVSDSWRGPFDDMDGLIAGAETPIHPATHYLTTALTQAARRHQARVVLNGLGGEFGPTFHGAGCFAEWLLSGRLPTLLRELSACARLENHSFISLLKREVIKPVLPAWLIARWKPRFELEHYLHSSPVRADFVREQLGADAGRARYDSSVYGRPGPDHRKIQFNMINYYRSYGRNHLHLGGQPGFADIEMSTPFFDRRLIEFCLALPGDMKVHNGYRRYLIRAGMRGVLPDSLRFRTGKEPYSPDFNDRYNRQQAHAAELLASTPRTELMRTIIDFDGLDAMLNYRMRSNRSNTPEDFACMHNVPRGLYLLTFLKSFG